MHCALSWQFGSCFHTSDWDRGLRSFVQMCVVFIFMASAPGPDSTPTWAMTLMRRADVLLECFERKVSPQVQLVYADYDVF